LVISKVLSSKSDVAYPDPVGTVTLEKVTYRPSSNPCAVLLTVTVAEPVVASKSAPVIAVSSGVMS
jgi:hypothetical protein